MAFAWLRLYTEYATDPKIQILAFEDQRHFVMLLCLKGNGTLDCVAPNDAYRERLIAKALGLDPASASEAKRRLIEGGLIAEDWTPVSWNNRQFVSDHDGAERQKRYRANRKRDSDGGVTTALRDGDALDSDSDSDSEQTQSRTSRAARSTGHRLPDDFEMTAERQSFAEAQGLDAAAELQQFRDYWRGVPGARGRKADWDATWRNSCRLSADRKASRPARPPARRPAKTADELDAEYEAANAQH